MADLLGLRRDLYCNVCSNVCVAVRELTTPLGFCNIYVYSTILYQSVVLSVHPRDLITINNILELYFIQCLIIVVLYVFLVVCTP